MWRGNPDLPNDRQGVVVLGTPVGHPASESQTEEHNILLQRISAVHDLQSAWVLLLFCAAARRTSGWRRQAQCTLKCRGSRLSVTFSGRNCFPSTIVGRARLEISHAFARGCSLNQLNRQPQDRVRQPC